MAVFTERQRHVSESWREFVLPNPTNGTEFNKALTTAYQHFAAVWKRQPYDDEIIVRATEEEIFLTFKFPEDPVNPR